VIKNPEYIATLALGNAAGSVQHYLLGLGICTLTFNPVLLTVELVHAMEHPQDFMHAVTTAAMVSSTLFFLVGGLVAWQWG
jgi:hypothetical protein